LSTTAESLDPCRPRALVAPGRHYFRCVHPDESSSELPVQLPLLVDEPPEEAGPLLDVIERLRAYVWDGAGGTLRDMADASTVRSILQRQANAMEMMLASFEQSRPMVLVPGRHRRRPQRA
jgi:hypothetical protein